MTRDHWTQVAAFALSVCVMIGTATWMLASQMSAVRADYTSALAVLSSRVASNEERLLAVEKVETSHYSEEMAFRTEMRASLTAIISGLADVRVAVSTKNHGSK